MSERFLNFGKYLIKIAIVYFGVIFGLLFMPGFFTGTICADEEVDPTLKSSDEAAMAVAIRRNVENYLPSDNATVWLETNNARGLNTTISGYSVDDLIEIKDGKGDFSIGDLSYKTGTDTLTFTTIANFSAPTKTIFDIEYMQEMTSAICDATPTPFAEIDGALNVETPETTLVDSRDGKVYLVRKLADGHCWMAENLALDLSSEKTYTSLDTDISSTYNQEKQDALIRNVKNADDYLVRVADTVEGGVPKTIKKATPTPTPTPTPQPSEPIDNPDESAESAESSDNPAPVESVESAPSNVSNIIENAINSSEVAAGTELPESESEIVPESQQSNGLAEAISQIEAEARARAEEARSAEQSVRATEQERAAEIEKKAAELTDESTSKIARTLGINLPEYFGFTPENNTQETSGERWRGDSVSQVENDVTHSQKASDPALGNYYNWYAATAGTGTYYMEDAKAGSSICPKGWELPASEGAKSFVNLVSIYKFTGDTTDFTLRDYLTSAPLSLSLAGAYYYNGLIGGENEWGNYWTKDAENLVAASFDVETMGMNYSQKTNGYSIRCVEK